jgi:hypothetical protein
MNEPAARLVQRIDRFVRRIQTEGLQPGPDCQLRGRPRMPRAGRLPGGEDAMIWASAA